MNAKILVLCSIVLAGSSAWAAPPQRMAYDPNDPEKARPIIPREERDKLGLTPHAWEGVVDPEVYAALDRLERTVAELKQRVERGAQRAQQTGRRDLDGGDAIKTLFGIRFEGTVYIQVHLKHELGGRAKSAANKTAIKETQRRVLSHLTAADFFAPFLFETQPGFTGYATREALDKLAQHPDVVGVCLDDMPIPQSLNRIFKSDAPPEKPGDLSATQPGVREGTVAVEVYRAFDLSERLEIVVGLKRDSLQHLLESIPEGDRERIVDRKQASLQLQDKVLTTLTADDFWLTVRGSLTFDGSISKPGLETLAGHPDVAKIDLPVRIAPRPPIRRQ